MGQLLFKKGPLLRSENQVGAQMLLLSNTQQMMPLKMVVRLIQLIC